MAVRAVLFDIDGTLVDSNYLHIDAWQRAFDEAKAEVDGWRIHRAIGMDSEALLDELAPDDADRATLKDAHSAHYRAAAGRLRTLPGARELLIGLRERGIAVVLATSAPQDELELLLDVLDLPSPPITTNADDVDTAKPHPGIVDVALERAGVSADDALFVGDAMWDMIAARRADVRAVGVRSGGVGADELADAGAEEVVDDVHELLARGEAWPADRAPQEAEAARPGQPA